MLEVRQIRLIVSLAEHGNLVRAGRVLAMSPSALTRAVSVIEDKLGAALFDRSRRGFEPTAICRAIIAKGGELLSKADELAAIVAQLGNQPGDRTIISAGPAALDTIVGPAIAMLLSRQPAAQAQILDGSAVDAVRALVERRASFAIAEVSDLDSPDELFITPLRRHPFFVPVRPGHPLLALGHEVRAADIFRFPFVVPAYVSARFAPHLASALALARSRHDHRPFPAIVADNAGVSLAIAAQSDALVSCTARGALPHLRSGALSLVPWRPAWLETNFAVMCLRGTRPTAVGQAMIECLHEADAASFLLAQELMVAGMAPLAETFAVVGRRTAPALTATREGLPVMVRSAEG